VHRRASDVVGAWRGPAARRGRSRPGGAGHAASPVQLPHSGV